VRVIFRKGRLGVRIAKLSIAQAQLRATASDDWASSINSSNPGLPSAAISAIPA